MGRYNKKKQSSWYCWKYSVVNSISLPFRSISSQEIQNVIHGIHVISAWLLICPLTILSMRSWCCNFFSMSFNVKIPIGFSVRIFLISILRLQSPFPSSILPLFTYYILVPIISPLFQVFSYPLLPFIVSFAQYYLPPFLFQSITLGLLWRQYYQCTARDRSYR